MNINLRFDDRGLIAAVLTDGRADAALAASLFHYRQLSVGQVKSYLRTQGIAVRE